jgi:Family of unknown function (DUF5677)
VRNRHLAAIAQNLRRLASVVAEEFWVIFATKATGFFESESTFGPFVRKRPESKPWFDLADDLNRAGIELLRAHSAPLVDPQHFTFSGIFVRAHQSFQASIVLIENGMIGDARTVLRSAAESGIALNALAIDPTFVDRLVDAYQHSQRRVANVTLANPEYRKFYSVSEVAQMESTVRNVDNVNQNPATKTSDIKWEQVAAKHCPDLYQLVYRHASADVHVTVNSIQRYFVFDAKGRIEALNVAPNADGLVDTLRLACIAMLWALEAYARLYPKASLTDELQNLLRRFDALPTNEFAKRDALSLAGEASSLPSESWL